MTRLRALLVAIGSVIVAGGSVLLLRVGDGVTVAALQDAGLASCPRVDLACEVRVSDERLAEMQNRGVDGGRRYRRVLLDGRDCTDGGLGYVVTDRRLYSGGAWVGGFEVIDRRCRVAGSGNADDGGARVAEMQLECGCREATGLCRFLLPDAGLHPVPFGRTVGPGYPMHVDGGLLVETDEFAGAGCARKSCIEVLGESSWPETCPGGG